MIGQIESYDPDTQSGVIISEGASFTFQVEGNWVADVPPDEGDDVNFVAEGTVANNINWNPLKPLNTSIWPLVWR